MTSETRSSVSCSMPLVALTISACRDKRRRRPDDGARAVRRQRRHDDVGPLERFFERCRRRNTGRQHDVGKVHRVGAPRLSSRRSARDSCPTAGRRAPRSRDETRAPCPSSPIPEPRLFSCALSKPPFNARKHTPQIGSMPMDDDGRDDDRRDHRHFRRAGHVGERREHDRSRDRSE